MNELTFENLDLTCAKKGRELVKNHPKELEKILTNALGVLEEQGLYAMFLYLNVQKDKGEKLSGELFKFLRERPLNNSIFENNNKTTVFDVLPELSENLDKLLFARDLVRQTLVYARYHAKCQIEDGGSD